MRLLYRPIGLLFSVVGGLAASAIFKRVWRAVAHEGEAPSPTDASRGWGEIVIAAALEGAVFGAVKAIADRGGDRVRSGYGYVAWANPAGEPVGPAWLTAWEV